MEKFTFIEPHVHLDGAQFGPSSLGGVDDDREEYEAGETGSSGPGVGGMVLLSLVLAVVATVVARRLFGGDDDGGEQATLDLDVEADAPAPEQ